MGGSDQFGVVIPTRRRRFDKDIVETFAFEILHIGFVGFAQRDAIAELYVGTGIFPRVSGGVAEKKRIRQVISEAEFVLRGLDNICKRPSRAGSYSGTPSAAVKGSFLAFPPWRVAE